MSLAYLDSLPKQSASRYDIMININQFFAWIDKPYSPGAFYHEIKKQAELKLIIINHDSVAVTALAKDWLARQFTQSPLPDSIVGKATFLAATTLLLDPSLRQIALKRLEIEMINYNQISSSHDRGVGRLEWATNTCLSNLRTGLKKAVLEIGAQ